MGVKWVPALLVSLVDDAVADRAKHHNTQELLEQLEPGTPFPTNTANTYKRMWCENAMEWATLNATVAYTRAKPAHSSSTEGLSLLPNKALIAAQAKVKAFEEHHFKDKEWTPDLKSQLQILGQTLNERAYAKSKQEADRAVKKAAAARLQASVEQEASHHHGNKKALTSHRYNDYDNNSNNGDGDSDGVDYDNDNDHSDYDGNERAFRTVDQAGRYGALTKDSASEEEERPKRHHAMLPPQISLRDTVGAGDEMLVKNLTAGFAMYNDGAAQDRALAREANTLSRDLASTALSMVAEIAKGMAEHAKQMAEQAKQDGETARQALQLQMKMFQAQMDKKDSS